MVTLVTLRWLVTWSLSPHNHQAIRYLFMQRLLAAFPSLVLLTDEDDCIAAQVGEHTCTLHLEALYRRCHEFPYQADLFIRETIQALQQACEESGGLPTDWQTRIMAQLLRVDAAPAPDIVRQPVIDSLAVGYMVEEESTLRWVTQQDLDVSGVTVAELHPYALRNLERSCNMLVIETLPPQPDGDDRVLRFTTHDGFDATRMLLPSFYQRFAPRFGDEDLLVGIPTRDTLIMVAALDHSHANLLSWRAGSEYTQHAYPLYDNLLRITENGLELWQPSGAVDEG